MREKTFPRREFMMMVVAGTAVTALALNAKGLPKFTESTSPEDQVGSEHQWAMVIDLNRCVGCGDCQLACQARNDTAPGASWVRMVESGELNGKPINVPVPCMHCQEAPCVSVCPVKATYKRADGIVVMDYDRCIGCRYCQLACSYGARTFNWQEFTGENPAVPEWGEPEIPRRPRGVVEKCSFCVQRIDRGLAEGLIPGVDPQATPACVVACPRKARYFGDLNDPDSPVSQVLKNHQAVQLRRDLGTDPRVYYLPAANRPDPEADLTCG
ncbi:MAG: 4Fe-4S ferredoxin [Chloroflexota bacterium]|nr:MAG: 4Fe-4S ferredoxin [Chloroflexota bacterium]